MKIYLILTLVFSFTIHATDVNEELGVNEGTLNPVVNVSDFVEPTSVLFNNGSIVNSVGTGAGGLDESLLQNTSLNMTTIGFGHQLNAGLRIAEDFTIVGGDWTISSIIFYAYQTGEIASTITSVNLRIWDGVPGAQGSNIIFGDETTNRMSSTVNSNILRAAESTSGTVTNRQVAASTVDVNMRLSAGTYWLDWQSGGSGASGPWCPPITITGQRITGNARNFDGSVWDNVTDGATTNGQGLPFIIQGSVVLNAPTPVPFLSNLTLLLLTFFMFSFGFNRLRTKNAL